MGKSEPVKVFDQQLILQAAKERLEQLTSLKNMCEAGLKSAPAGTLRVDRHGKVIQYYNRIDPAKPNGEYIPVSNRDLAVKLAQKEYEQKMLKSVNEEIKVLLHLIEHYPACRPEDVMSKVAEPKRGLIRPFHLSEEEFVERWKSVEYISNPFYESRDNLMTEQGEIVKSKSELIIANLLFQAGVPYRYEFPLSLGRQGTVYPDFMILNKRLRKEILWEHLGMMDIPEYAEKAVRKITAYEENGYFPGENLILTMETKDQPLDVRLVKKMIRKYAV